MEVESDLPLPLWTRTVSTWYGVDEAKRPLGEDPFSNLNFEAARLGPLARTHHALATESLG